MRRLGGAIVLALGAAVLACGGSVVSVTEANGEGPDGGPPVGDAAPGTPASDAFAPSDASPVGAGCPAQTPIADAPCSVPGLSCEYGGFGDHLLCSTVATCQPGAGKGTTWYVSRPAKDCISSPAANPAECPSSFGAIPMGGACPQAAPGQCVYAEGVCGCVPCAPDGSNAFTNEWACASWPAPSGCPAARPRLGTPCAPEGQSCMYANVCDVNDGEPAIGCQSGRWVITPFGADCAIRQCGK
jgi:hypothetical protein